MSQLLLLSMILSKQSKFHHYSSHFSWPRVMPVYLPSSELKQVFQQLALAPGANVGFDDIEQILTPNYHMP
jgi:hypothetical protein